MRISSDTADPAYQADVTTGGWLVLFNGIPQGRDSGRIIITADEELTFITYRRPGETEINTETGRVFIMRNPNPPPKPSPDPCALFIGVAG